MMSLLIDGYNLLNVTGIFGPRPGLERSRAALLDFLAGSLNAREREHTVVVFDAKAAPPGLPRVVDHSGLTVRFAARYDEADTLIEELIQADSAPKQLTVVSSDHRIQRAARRRRARAVDSERWYCELQQRRGRSTAASQSETKPPAPVSEKEVDQWLDQFGSPQSPGPAEPEVQDLLNPFPPGYAEDLLDEFNKKNP